MSVPYRADHIGSFLRPRNCLKRGAGNPEGLRAIEDRDILRVLAKQKELGFEIFTDGELRRSNFMSDFTDAVEGFDFEDAMPRDLAGRRSRRPRQEWHRAGIVTQKLRAVRPLTGHELPFLKQHSPGAIKMTLPSATQFPAISFKRGVTDKVYKDHSALLWDIVEIMKAEMARAIGRGREVHPDRRAALQLLHGPEVARMDSQGNERGCRTPCWTKPSAPTTPAFEAARRPGVDARHSPLPRQQPQPLVRRRRLRRDRREALHARSTWIASCSNTTTQRSGTFEPLRFVPRRTRSWCWDWSAPNWRELEDSDTIVRRIRRGGAVRAAREPRAQPAVRLRLHDGRESADRGRAVGQAAARRRDGPPRVEVTGRCNQRVRQLQRLQSVWATETMSLSG